jgi:glutathione peroxidase
VDSPASYRGVTQPNGAPPQEVDTYRARAPAVRGEPSTDFGGQEPGTAPEITHHCEVNFAVDFPLTEKQVVKGAAAHPFFREVVAELGADAAPRWNFHKFLVTPDGRLAGTWPSRVEPDAPEVTAAIEAVLPR